MDPHRRYTYVMVPKLVECGKDEIDRGTSAANELYALLGGIMQYKFSPSGCMPLAVEKMKRIQELLPGLQFSLLTRSTATHKSLAEIGKLIDEMSAFPEPKVVSWFGTVCLQMEAMHKVMLKEAGV